MRAGIWDGQNYLTCFIDVDENALYVDGKRYPDNYNMRFALWFMRNNAAEYREWLPER